MLTHRNSMILLKTILLITSLALGITVWTYANADDRDDDYQPSERFKLRVGGFIFDRFDTTQFPIGTLIDLEENFNVGISETVLRVDGFYRFNNRHRVDCTWYHSLHSGTDIAAQEYIIGDPDDP